MYLRTGGVQGRRAKEVTQTRILASTFLRNGHEYILCIDVRVLHSDRDEQEEDADEALNQGRQVVGAVQVVVLEKQGEKLALEL